MVKRGKPNSLALKTRLLEGIQVLTAEGILTGSGHLSVRLPGTETFLINPRYAGILARPQDICTVDFSGKRVAGKEPLPLETAIHTAVYRNRPDVASVLHCHARYSVLVSLLETGLVPFDREASLFADGVPIFPDSHGIRGDALARKMVETLGNHYAVFLKGHGIVVVGPTIEGTCVSALQLERSCQDQLLLMSFTTPKPLAHWNEGRVAPKVENPYRAWPYLLHRYRIKSKPAIRATAKAMIRSLWPDEK
jgi:L-fuculose-phosphate aldolase